MQVVASEVSEEVSRHLRGRTETRAAQHDLPGRAVHAGLGDVKVELHHFGRAHTGGDTVVYFSDLKQWSI